MIYFKPLGGLGNRMRAIDSMISICANKGRNLTILWTKELDFNCSFDTIFKVDMLSFQIIEVPVNFPEDYLSNRRNLNFFKLKSIRIIDYFIRQLRNQLRGRLLTNKERIILRELRSITSGELLLNDDFSVLYSSKNQVAYKSIQQLDLEFIDKIEPRLSELVSERDFVFISSCFRLSRLNAGYSSFVPTRNIQIGIDSIVKKFCHTIGVHIRRTDHLVAKEYSTTDKFVNRMTELVLVNPEITFFLATDSKDVKSKLKAIFGTRLLIQDFMDYGRDNSQGIVNAVIDLYCLAKTQMILGSYHSTFSQIAGQIGGVPVEEVK